MIKLGRTALAILAASLLGVAIGAGQALASPVPVEPSGIDAVDAALALPGVTHSVLLDAATGVVLVDKRDIASPS